MNMIRSDKWMFLKLGAVVLAAIICMALGTSDEIFALFEDPSHMDPLRNKDGCIACHAGRGVVGTALLRAREEKLCFLCHGRDTWRRSGTDMERPFVMRSHHPVLETSGYHRSFEQLPETKSSTERHVSCLDCHITHVSTPSVPFKGRPGFRPSKAREWRSGTRPMGVNVKEATQEYEICYQCHSESANLPDDSRNVAVEFNTSGASFHPVEMAGTNGDVPSLRGSYSESSIIKCGSCHNNSDRTGPRGPHGSDFPYILAAPYKLEDGPESMFAYRLCYECHDRKSILSDESFAMHNKHIALESTACHTCHNSHGSPYYQHLIDFNEEVVTASPVSGGPDYIVGTTGKPRCYLSCHGIDHNSNNIGGTQWPW